MALSWKLWQWPSSAAGSESRGCATPAAGRGRCCTPARGRTAAGPGWAASGGSSLCRTRYRSFCGRPEESQQREVTLSDNFLLQCLIIKGREDLRMGRPGSRWKWCPPLEFLRVSGYVSIQSQQQTCKRSLRWTVKNLET